MKTRLCGEWWGCVCGGGGEGGGGGGEEGEGMGAYMHLSF